MLDNYTMKNFIPKILILCLAIMFFVLSARGCTDPKGAAYTLSVSGYTNVELTGPVWFGGQDPYRTGFRAVAPNGAHVSGQVTSGLFNKGSTIRIY